MYTVALYLFAVLKTHYQILLLEMDDIENVHKL